jgi:hypothetical protein
VKKVSKFYKSYQTDTNFDYYDESLSPSIESYFDTATTGIQLSPGEDLCLLLLLWSFHADLLARARNKPVAPIKYTKRILLLDEPDAHMHPSLTKSFMHNLLNKNLIRFLNMQIIMTTHSPVTVSLAPTDTVFVMTRDRATRAAAENITDPLQLLTDDFTPFYTPFQLCFVEACEHAVFYEYAAKFFYSANLLANKMKIEFRCVGPRSKVEQLVKLWCSAGPEGETKNKKNRSGLLATHLAAKPFSYEQRVFAICDGVNRVYEGEYTYEGNEYKFTPPHSNIFYSKQYGIENYVLNPVNMTTRGCPQRRKRGRY